MWRSARRDRSQAGDQGGPCAGTGGNAQSVHAGQPALALPKLPQTQDQTGPATGEISVSMLAGLVRRAKDTAALSLMVAVVSVAVQSGTCLAAGDAIK